MTERGARIGLLLLLGGYLAARLIVLVRGNIYVSFDTASYTVPPVSLTGAAPRLWGVPAFYALLQNDQARVVGQWLVATSAWALLAWVVWSMLRHQVARVVGAAAVLVLAILDAVGNWDLALLSESLSISLGVLTLALLLRWFSTGHPVALIGATAAAFWWTFVRPDIRVFTVIVILALGVIAWRRANRRRAGLIAAGVLIIAIGWCSAILPSVNRAGAAWSGLGAEHSANEWLLYRLRVQVLPDPAIKAVFADRLGMPPCPAAEAIASRPTWDIKEFAEAVDGCAELSAWTDANRDDVFTRFATVAPVDYARMTLDLVTQSWRAATYADVPSVIPAPAQKLVFPGRYWPLAVVIGGLLIGAAAVVATRAWNFHRTLVTASVALAVACLVSTLGGVLLGTGEFWRFGVQEAIGLRLAALLLALAALDAYLLIRAVAPTGPGGQGRLGSMKTRWSKLTEVTKT